MSHEYARMREELIKRLDIRAYYESSLGVQLQCDSEGWSQKIHCCFHDDTATPNMGVNIITGGFSCFACEPKSAGSVFDFHCMRHGFRPDEKFVWAFNELAILAGMDVKAMRDSISKTVAINGPANAPAPHEPKINVNKADEKDKATLSVSKSVVEEFCSALQPEHYEYLSQKRGLTLATIQEYEIGWDDEGYVEKKDGAKGRFGRYTIPIYNKSNEVRNVRTYSPDSIPAHKMKNTKTLGSPPRLMNLHRLLSNNWKHVIITEGEFDCILMNQKLTDLGLSASWGAVTVTHGCTTWSAEFNEYLVGRSIYFCYDCDDPGMGSMSSICTKHFLHQLKAKKFECVKIIKLPLEGSKEYKDITDYFVKLNLSAEDLISLCKRSLSLESGGVAADEATVAPIKVDSFVDCIKGRSYIDRRVQVPVAISGQTSNVYHAIREYKVSRCPEADKCCSLSAGTRFLPYGHEAFIAACGSTKGRMIESIRGIACTNDARPQIAVVSKVVMEEYMAHQVIRRWVAEENPDTGRMENVQQLTVVPVYVLQPESHIKIEPQNYMATGWVRSHPNTQQATLFIEHLELLEADWSKFELNEKSITSLKKLQGISVGDKMREITANVTRIYESDEILLTVLLTYLSIIRFAFDKEVINGWVNSCILGDSGVGKSKTYSTFADWVQVGDLFSALTGSRTGLLYALKTKGKEWYIHTGRYVVASRQVIAIDEAQEAHREDIGEMTLAMETGTLDVNKVAQARFTTETRACFILNAPDNRKVSDYPMGCLALGDVFLPRFIRRLDLAVVCVAKHKLEFYNQKQKDKTEQKFTAEDFRCLVYYAWTRRANDVIFNDETIEVCLNQAIELSKKYGHCDDIPLVDPQGFRKKLARLSVSYAVLSCSFTPDFKKVVVLPKHVMVISAFLDAVYSSASCNLLQHAKLSKKKKSLDDYDTIRQNFTVVIDDAKFSEYEDYRENNYFCQMLLLLQQANRDGVRVRDLKDQIGVSMKWLQRHLAVLHAYNLIEVYKINYRTTSKFNLFMQRWQTEDGIEKMLDNVHMKIGQRAFNKSSQSNDFNMSSDEDPFSDVDTDGPPPPSEPE